MRMAVQVAGAGVLGLVVLKLLGVIALPLMGLLVGFGGLVFGFLGLVFKIGLVLLLGWFVLRLFRGRRREYV